MDIILSNSSDMYFAGNKVSGRVLFTLQTETQVRGIVMEVRGKEHACFAARTKYYDSRDNKMKYESGSCWGGIRYNNFLEVDLALSGRKKLNPGQHELPINFPLPKDLPTSYQGKYGYVKYYIRVKVDVMNGHDFEGDKDFEVQSFIDFNEIISDIQMSPVTYQKETTLGFCCCPSGPITMDVRLNKIAFVSGEMAKITVEVINFSNDNVIKVLVKLTRTIKSRLEQRQRDFFRYEHDILSSNFDIGVPAKGENTYDFDLEIPRSATIYNFKRCMFLCQWFTLSRTIVIIFAKKAGADELNFFIAFLANKPTMPKTMLLVEAVLPGYNENLTIDAKVELGHIPLGGQLEEQRDALQETSHLVSSEPSNRRAISPPPTYSDAVQFFPAASPRDNLVGKHSPSAPNQ